jgi:peptidoglycan DL-endopeptidase CwlO
MIVTAKRPLLVTVCALGLLTGPASAGAYADPGGGGQSLEDVHKEVERLHDKAESATDAYNGAEERAEKQQKSVDKLTEKIDALRERRAKYRDTAGALARAQYRSGGMPDEARLMLR